MSRRSPETSSRAEADNAVRCLAHLPLVRLAEHSISFAHGRLLNLPYDEWSSWESDYRRLENSYARNRPVFYERVIPCHAELSPEVMQTTVAAPFDEECSKVYHSLALATGAALMEPAMSMVYHLIPAHLVAPSLHARFLNVSERKHRKALSAAPVSFGVMRQKSVGIMGREAILDWQILGVPEPRVLSAVEYGRARQCFEHLEAIRESAAMAKLDPILETLAMTARPEYDGIYGLVHNVRILETFLAPEKLHQDTISRRVARRLAPLWASDPADLESSLQVGKQLYNLRSEALHGRNWQRALARTSYQDALFDVSRQAAVLVTAAFLLRAWQEPEAPAHGFVALLDRLWEQRRSYTGAQPDAT